MTHNSTILRPKIALYEPDIPQNTAAIIRTCACLGAKIKVPLTRFTLVEDIIMFLMGLMILIGI